MGRFKELARIILPFQKTPSPDKQLSSTPIIPHVESATPTNPIIKQEVYSEPPAPSPELDFSTGAFWQTQLGEDVKDFAIAQIEKGARFPRTPGHTSYLLGLRTQNATPRKVADLARMGILADVKADGRSFDLELPHAILCGLLFLYLERGYSPAGIAE
ncbi:MAG: hypothetical protein Q8P89_00310, partial [bacterium]|nr:hypothetical protein [bacterium]